MKATTTAVIRYDHNDECIGCGAHLADPCGTDCPVQTGEITCASPATPPSTSAR